MDVEKIYKEVYEEKLAWSKLNNGYGGIAHLLKEVEHPDKKHLEEIIKDYTPDKFKELEAVKKGARNRTTLKVNISDLKRIGKLIDRLEIVTEENSRLREIETKYKKAKKVYFSNPHERKDKMAVKAVQILGWSTGKRPKKISQKKLFWEYIKLIKKENPMDKWEALELLREKYGLESREAALKHVQKYLKQFKENCELLCSYPELSYFTSDPKNKPDQFDGILPPNWPS